METKSTLTDTLEPINLKLILLGNSLVGKTAMTFRFVQNNFPKDHDTTIEDQFSLNITIEDSYCSLEILDTAGQDDYQSILDTWINSGEGFLLVYSIDDRNSFESSKKRLERIKRNKGGKFTVILAGNKCDLEDNRVVSKEEAEEYCKKVGIDFIECSALENINVKEAFLCVARKLLKKRSLEKYNNSGGVKKKRCYCF